MEEIGETFRFLRKERGFTLKTMSQGIMSFSSLGKFENNETDITLTKFIQLVKRLNMTMDEFLHFNEVRTTMHVELFHKISSAYLKNDQDQLQSFAYKERALYKETGIIYHKCNAIMILGILQDLDPHFIILQEDIDFLVDYIVNCSFWSAYEVGLLGNTLTFFTEELLLILLEEVKGRLKEDKVAKRNVRDLIALLENACIIFLRKRKMKETKELTLFLDSFIEPFHFFEKTRMIFIESLLLIVQGKKEAGKRKAEEAIQIMSFMNEQFAKDHMMELKTFLVCSE